MEEAFEQWYPEYATTGFIAKQCGVSNTTVLRWIERGLLPALRLPSGHYRIRGRDLAGFLSNHSMLVTSLESKNRASH